MAHHHSLPPDLQLHCRVVMVPNSELHKPVICKSCWCCNFGSSKPCAYLTEGLDDGVHLLWHWLLWQS
jgi:hypothetical protein